MYAVSKGLFVVLSRNRALKRLASKYGMDRHGGFARRFIAGETVEEVIDVSRRLQSEGLLLTLDYLGESARNMDEATAATAEYIRLLDRIVESGIERNISLKLTQLGIGVDRATCVDNLRRILEPAAKHGFFVRIDMESSRYTQITLDVFETLWQQQHRNIGVVLQSMLYRSEADLKRLNELGARVRLVKGAYKEPASVAYARKSDVDAAYVTMMRQMLDAGHYPAIGTHDTAIIDAARAYAASRGITADRFEFQMLYGIRRNLQRSLLAAGYRVRLYVPFGREWFPYYMRRLGERPANVTFVLKALLHDR